MSDPSPLGEAVEGLADLARWWTDLAGRQAAEVAGLLEGGAAAADDLTRAVARAAALPFIGWAALANELLDASAVLGGVRRVRDLDSDMFRAPETGTRRRLELRGPLTNGFGDAIPATAVEVRPSGLAEGERDFTLHVTGVGPDRVGVYRGEVVARTAADSIATVDVWLIVA